MNIAPQGNDTSLSDHDIGSNDQNITGVELISSAPSSSHDSLTFQMPNQTEDAMNISSLCNPNDEELSLRQPRESELFGNNLIYKRSWAKDSTCEQVSLL